MGNLGVGLSKGYVRRRAVELGCQNNGIEEIALFHRETHAGPTTDAHMIISFTAPEGATDALTIYQTAVPPTGLEWPGKRLLCRYAFARQAPQTPGPQQVAQTPLPQPKVVPPFVAFLWCPRGAAVALT